MTFVAKKNITANSVGKKFVFENFSFGKDQKSKTLSADYAAAVKVDGGKIKPAFLWEQFSVHGSLGKLYDTANGVRRAIETFDYSDGTAKRKFLYVAGSGEVYSYSEKAGGFVGDGLYFSDTPTILSAFTLDGLENLVYCSSDGVYFYDNVKRTAKKALNKASTIACLVWDRAFCARGTRVHFCAPLSFDDWENSSNGGGFIDFSSEKGEIVGLSGLGDELCVYFKRGISLLKVAGGAKEFERRDIAFPFGEILKGSATASGNKAVFLTENGGFCFDGKVFEEIFERDAFGEIAKDCVCESLSFLGEAYIRYSLLDGRERMLVYDGEKGQGYFVEEPNAGGMSASKDKLFCSKEGKIYVLSENGGVEYSSSRGFSVKQERFSYEGEKTLKNLIVKGKGKARIAVSTKRSGHVYTLSLTKDGSTVFPFLKGEAFDLNIVPLGGAEVTCIEADVEFIGRNRI